MSLRALRRKTSSGIEGKSSKTKGKARTRPRSASGPIHPAWAWLLGTVQLLAATAFFIWLLAWPPVFKLYYPLLGIAPETQDAVAIVEWLSSDRSLSQLENAMRGGILTEKEILHYADVRYWFKWLPWIWGMGGGALLLGCWRFQPSRETVAAVQWRALWLAVIIMLAAAVFAWWDWKIFFAWVHHPFFGSSSWVFPWSAYSLQLFPAGFWRLMGGLALAGPLLMILIILGGARLRRGR
jgi:hypothetical protein